MSDVVDLRAFYGEPLGQVAGRVLRAKIRGVWPSVAGERVLGFGYTVPYLGQFREEAERTVALMPAQQGAVVWPPGARSATGLVDPAMWPLQDEMFDRILLVHALEEAESPAELLGECWRCLGAGGRLLVIAASRRGPWARMDHTPFGHGRPFSSGQLGRLLRNAAFAPERSAEALLFPPFSTRLVLRSALALERIGARLWPVFAGVHIVEAVKDVRQAVPVRRRGRGLVRSPVRVLVPGTPAPAPPG